ncbi:uncharacterized protein MAM_03359 [Metarhizium album ARSEF 1941]|uniref:SPRY domain-containing protein n=1 Tax=Metarhizium album (strain ARSEF 1941) TaxID=1081103 RepID=A0A0B2WZN9_METAS|nr:uncharacterized protein MAM_03359 [Metarhizium album ARSEF 1941]KHN98897.1 hypothetical protein MAM_03359 [Metarhizium album ARSEF 1941]
MCSGGKGEEDDAAPRPAQQQAQRPGHVKVPLLMASSSPAASSSSSSHQQTYAPPSGPPPSYHRQQHAPPARPPPSQQHGAASPASGQGEDWAVPPPPEAPSSRVKPQHDWEAAVPDTSLLPPPPDIFSGHDSSPVNNASEAEAEAGEAWCARRPLGRPVHLDAASKTALDENDLDLRKPDGFAGKLSRSRPGHWSVSIQKGASYKCIIGHPPVYLARCGRGQPKTIYYEVKLGPGSKSANVAVGFAALPYPTSFRLPGWHRGSLAVHGDDGRKYVNDRWGGKDFTRPFVAGETLGVGMTFTPMAMATATGTPRPPHVSVSVFLTRDGVRAGAWDLHEETDSKQDLPVTGLEGFHDLCCAVGVFDGAELDVVFDPARWKYRV